MLICAWPRLPPLGVTDPMHGGVIVGTDPPAESPAHLLWDGVFLTPTGVRLVARVLAKATGKKAHRGDAPTPPVNEVDYLREVLRLSIDRAQGCAPSTSGEPVTVVLPSSDAQVTVTEAAAIWGVSRQAINKAIRVGTLQPVRVRPVLLSEAAVREAAVRRRRHARGPDGGHLDGGAGAVDQRRDCG